MTLTREEAAELILQASERLNELKREVIPEGREGIAANADATERFWDLLGFNSVVAVNVSHTAVQSMVMRMAQMMVEGTFDPVSSLPGVWGDGLAHGLMLASLIAEREEAR